MVADSKQLYNLFTNVTSEWPGVYQKRVTFEWHPVWYPRDREDMRTMFRTCATERLFLPEMFPTLDAAIYIDTDLIFLRPPEELWAEFHKFDAVQVAAMAPCLYHYGTSKNNVRIFPVMSVLSIDILQHKMLWWFWTLELPIIWFSIFFLCEIVSIFYLYSHNKLYITFPCIKFFHTAYPSTLQISTL